ncbi:MAG: hypothetical protein U0487_02820 [Patescibacteria group bacterium]
MSSACLFDQAHIIEVAKYLHDRNGQRMDFCLALQKAVIQAYDDDYSQMALYQITEMVRLYKNVYHVPRDYWHAAIEAVDNRPAELKRQAPLCPRCSKA